MSETRGKTTAATLRLDWRLALFALALALSFGMTRPAAGQVTDCNRREEVVEHLAKKYGEHLVAIGVTNDGGMVEVLATPGRDTWTIIISLPDGTSCMVAAGVGWRPVRAPVEEDPAA